MNYNSSNNGTILKFRPDGVQDMTFGVSGRANSPFANGGVRFEQIAALNDGTILVAGHAGPSFSTPIFTDLAFVRYNANGTLDTAYGTNGFAKINVNDAYDEVYGLALDSQGDSVIAGLTLEAPESKCSLQRCGQMARWLPMLPLR